MEKIDFVLIVDNNSLRVAEAQKKLRESKIGETIKVAVNGEHALVCLEHLNLFNSLKGKKIMVLLNMDTPIMNGMELLESGRFKSLPCKEQILMIVMKDVSSAYSVELAKQKGVTSFISSPVEPSELNQMASEYFGDKSKVKKQGKATVKVSV